VSGLLARMAVTSRERADAARAAEPLADLRARARDLPPAPPLRLCGFDLLAEVKLRAPSAGVLARPADPAATAAERAEAYAAAGAAAVSVLTEPTRFDGDLAHLAAAARACTVPVLRKDFLVDRYQVWEARAAGAGGVLLIVRMLDESALHALLDAAAEAGLFALVEAFDASDLARVAPLVARWPEGGPPLLAGVNSRDLRTLDIDRGRLRALAADLPTGAVPVAESGILVPEDAWDAAEAGYAMILVGTALMAAPDPSALARSLLASGRTVRGETR